MFAYFDFHKNRKKLKKRKKRRKKNGVLGFERKAILYSL